MSRLSLITLLILGCGDSQSTQKETVEIVPEVAPSSLIQASWPVRFAKKESRTAYEGQVGWVSYFNREFLTATGTLNGDAQARVHIEIAAVYRQAARLHAEASIHLFEGIRQESDPKEGDYFLAVSKVLMGDIEGAKSLLEPFSSTESELMLPATQWLEILEKNEFFPEPSGFSYLQWTEPTPGSSMPTEVLPHFQFNTLGEDAGSMDLTDGSTLWLRSYWHEQAALAAAPESKAVIEAWLTPFRLPVEKVETANFVSGITDDWLFLSYYLSPSDVEFMIEAQKSGLDSIPVHAEKSVFASTLMQAIDEGSAEEEGSKISVEKSLVAASRLKSQLLSEIETVNGTLDPVHSIFGELAEIGVLHVAMVIADSNNQYRDAGELRLNMRDLVQKSPKNPLYFLELSAWDTGNKAPLRPQEIMHRFSEEFPALSVARFPLDSLHIRISRGSGPGAIQ